MVLATIRGNGADGRCAPEGVGGRIAIADGDVHVWRASLDVPSAPLWRLHRTLADDERARAARFRFERDRRRYVAARGQLRRLLGEYLGVPAAALRFGYGHYHKPHLDPPAVSFNVTHSGAVALYAISAAGDVGIDVEMADGDYAREPLAERFFSRAEVRALRALPRAQQARAFLTCWTRKEAFVKARGDGLSLDLASFDVSLSPDAPPALLRTAWAPEEAAQWRLVDLSDTDDGYIAALALPASGRLVQRQRLSDIDQGASPRQEEG